MRRARAWHRSAALLFATPLLGMVVRFGHTGLPWSVRKYGGSVLWAAMIYWVLSTVLPRMTTVRVALVAEFVATGVEFLKRVHTTSLEAFRSTVAGVLLLGRQFSYRDILAYTLAIACVAYADDRWLRFPSSTGKNVRAV